MRLQPLSVLALGVVILVGGLLAVGEANQRQDRPDFTGVWLLNWELSDSPRGHVPAAAGEGTRRRAPAWPGGRGGFGGPGRDGSGRPSRGDREDVEARAREDLGTREAVADLLTAPRRMTITQDARERSCFRTTMGGTCGSCRTVGSTPGSPAGPGSCGRCAGRTGPWSQRSSSNPIRKWWHEFALRLGGEQLELTTTLEPRGSQDELQLRRVYDAAGE